MIKKILNYTILIFLIIILIYTCFSKYIRQDNVVKIGNYGILVVMTGSMKPEIDENELILIKECETYDLDDIVTYLDSDGNLITHRIVQIDEYSFISRGDYNDTIDENTDVHKIEGKVIYHSKVLGIFILYYLKFVILIYVVILLVIYLKEKLIKETENESEKKEFNNRSN